MAKKATKTAVRGRGAPAVAPIHVALLRGVNVGGKHRLPMAELALLFRDAGADDVRTFIQSGNVLFRAPAARAAAVAAAVAAAIPRRFGFTAPVVLRSARELAALVDDNPFLRAGADPKTLHVLFLAAAPTRAQAAGLDPERSPGDAFALRGRELYLHLPNGVARTKLTNDWFDRTLATVATLRNWNTVQKLVALAEAVP